MELLIHDVTLAHAGQVIPHGYVLIQDNRIAALGAGSPGDDLRTATTEALDASGKVLLPGLVNAHTHLEQTFMRGYSAGRPLLAWLKDCIWKLQAAMEVEDVRLAAMLGLVEAIRGGATTIVDHHKVPLSHRHTEVVLEAAQALGVRLTLARAWADRGAHAEAPADILADLERLFAEWHNAAEGRIQIANGPLVPWRCSAETLQRAGALARRYGALTHCHVNETQAEVAITVEETGLRPLVWFDRLGLLGPDFQAVHGVWLSDEEITCLVERKATVVHCPAANMILGSGVAPIPRLLAAGVKVTLGSDGPASNDGQDMFETMRLAAYLQRAVVQDASILPPPTVLAMASGASLAIGAKADLVLLDFGAAHIQPVGNVLASILYNVRGSDVDTVIVDGRLLMRHRQMIDLDEDGLIAECRARAAHLARRAGIA
jgi:5-methylthioadenosine/S-adenosylhomocysteine deaminase